MNNNYEFRDRKGDDSVQEYTCKYCGKKYFAPPNTESKYCSLECLKNNQSKNDHNSSEQYRNELMYQTTMSIVRDMLDQGIITEDDYRQAEDFFVEKYDPVIGKLFSSIDFDKIGKK